MAKNLTFNLQGKEYPFSTAKLDRSKLYGWTEVLALDKEGKSCKTLYMDRTGTLLIPKGGFTYGILDAGNNWVDKSELQAVDMDGNPAPLVPSSFAAPVMLEKTATVEEVLDHAITSVYELNGESGELLKSVASGIIYTFIFNWKEDYEGDDAFLIESKNKLYVLVGKKLEFGYIGIEEQGFVSDDEEEKEETDEIDFSMM
jgi:hypothetical protein